MKRNWDVIREIMIELEEIPSNGWLDSNAICGADDETALYHMRMMVEAGLAVGGCPETLEQGKAREDFVATCAAPAVPVTEETTLPPPAGLQSGDRVRVRGFEFASTSRMFLVKTHAGRLGRLLRTERDDPAAPPEPGQLWRVALDAVGNIKDAELFFREHELELAPADDDIFTAAQTLKEDA